MERLLDRVARELGLDRAEVRRRNLVPAHKMPYQTGVKNRGGMPVVLDTGDYLRCQQDALERAGWEGFAATAGRGAKARSLHRHRACELRQRDWPRSVRDRDGARRSFRPDSRLYRRGRDGTKHQDHARADRRRSAGRRHGERHRRRGRHGHRADGHGWLEQPAGRACGNVRALGGAEGAPEDDPHCRASSGGRRSGPRHRWSLGARQGCEGDGGRLRRRSRARWPVRRASACPAASRPGWKRSKASSSIR